MSRSLSNHDGKGNGSENVTYQKWIRGISNLIRYSIIPFRYCIVPFRYSIISFRYSIIPFRSNLSNVRKRNRGLIRPSVPLRIEFLILIPKGFSPRQVHQFFLLFKGNTSKLILDLNARRQVERRSWVMNYCIVKGLSGTYSAFWQVHCEKINDTLTPSFLRNHYGTSKQRNQMLFLISTPQSRTYP